MIAFQDLILRLQNFWGARGCALLQPYDLEVGAGIGRQLVRARTGVLDAGSATSCRSPARVLLLDVPNGEA